MNEPTAAAADILIEGRVQGVGYRDFAQRRADRLGLVGWVMNLRDGRVRVHAEGARETIETLAAELRRGPTLARVQHLSIDWVPPAGHYAAFGIRYADMDR